MSAAEKINKEMQEKPNDPYVEILGHYLIDRAGAGAADDALIGADGKTLKGAMREVTSAARKKAKSNVAVMADTEVFDIVDRYFGLSPDRIARQRALAPAAAAQTVTAARSSLGLDLEDLL